MGHRELVPQGWSDRALKLHPLSTQRCPGLSGGATLPFTFNMKASLNKPRINQPKINNWSVLYSAPTTISRLLLYTHMRITGRSQKSMDGRQEKIQTPIGENLNHYPIQYLAFWHFSTHGMKHNAFTVSTAFSPLLHVVKLLLGPRILHSSCCTTVLICYLWNLYVSTVSLLCGLDGVSCSPQAMYFYWNQCLLSVSLYIFH
jgi:hypothetical protein